MELAKGQAGEYDGDEENLEEQSLQDIDLIEKPTVPSDIIQLKHSFGYDCKRIYNLLLIDEDTLVFASGNLIHYFSISRRQVTFRNSQFGAGIGFITKNYHPDFQNLLTVGENGPNATIFVYEYPSHEVIVKLEGAAKNQFTCGSYNHNGELFASQAGHPDFMLTIWRWQKKEVVLRSKSFQNDILHVHFSKFNPILLASCGLSHIKFWKMANTFTGLKLQGDLGRFGKTDFSDIYAIYMLPDENVISGCEWGNILLWEAGLIKFEVCRKGRKPCHEKPITWITMDNGEVMTVGMDGYVRIWFWETVDLADPPDDDRFVEIEPIYEFKIGDCEIRSIQKIKLFDDKDYGYYAQDGKGGIWYCDLNVYDLPNEPKKLYSTHGGKVVAAQCSPISKHLMTLGEDGKVFVYDYEKKILLLNKQFISIGTDLLWFNTNISNNGMELVAGFDDGILRHLLLDIDKKKIKLVRAIKGHTAPLTRLAINPKNNILVTGGGDQTIFMYSLNEKYEGLVKIHPMGFVKFDGIPNAFNWKKDKPSTLLIGCKSGEVYEYKLPIRTTDEQTFLTYNLFEQHRLKYCKFASVKSRIRRDIRREQIKMRKALKRKRKLKDIEKLKAANPGLQIDMESALADSEPDEEEEPLHIPAKPNSVLWLRYTNDDTIWASMAGYDAGYVYELKFDTLEPVKCTIIPDGDDCEIHSNLIIGDFLIFGLINGKLRINQTVEDFTDLTDYRLFNMHDPLRGCIPRIIQSFDGKNIFSIGSDGNIFMYDWNGPNTLKESPPQTSHLPIFTLGEDIDDPEYPSLEQEKIFAEIKRQEAAAAAHDRKVLYMIGDLQIKFNEIMRENRELPESLQIPLRDMLMDPRTVKQIGDELQAELDDVREDLAYDLEVAQVGKQKLYDYFLKNLDHIPIKLTGIGRDAQLYSFRIQKLGEDFEQMKADIEERLRLEAEKRGITSLAEPEEKEDSIPEPGIEDFFFGRDPYSIIPRFSKKMLRLLRRYRSRQLYEIDRIYNWDKLERQKPDPNKNHPDDDRKIKEAEKNLGDYKLKIGADYEPKPNETLTYKYIHLVDCREQNFKLLNRFNQRIFDLREQKRSLCEYVAKMHIRLQEIHKFIPPKNRINLKHIAEIIIDDMFPEHNLVEHFKPGCGIEIRDILYLEKTVKDLLPKPPAPVNTLQSNVNIDQIELEQFHLLGIAQVEYLPELNVLIQELEKLPKPTDPMYFERVGNKPSPWLTETRYRWILDLIAEQNVIIFIVNNQIEKFNDDLKRMLVDRLYVKFDADFMQTYMISLCQELYILKDSEEIENKLLKNADNAMRSRNDIQKSINLLNRQIDEARKGCDKLTDQINTVQLKFMGTCRTHKFFDFLRRIFKKKYKLPKLPKLNEEDSSESSSESSSSSEDENADTKSIDSTDMTTIRLDETHCPPGLERPMYELVFKMRTERHGFEQAFLEQQRLIEKLRAEVLTLQKQMKYHEDIYAAEQETLLVFRRKRQQEINKVQTCIVLKVDQIQHFVEGEDYRDLSKAVLFDATRLSSLQYRVEELKIETLETKRLHRINIVHLRRMNTDIKFMRQEIIKLDEAIKDEMMKKFGMVINLDELEEEVLRKYIFELETTAEEELRAIENEIKIRKKELAKLEEELIRETQSNTEKLNILSILQEEKNFLEEILYAQEKCYDKWLKPSNLKLDPDIERLMVIDKQQKEQITCLEREICTLRMKAKPLQMDEEVKGDNLNEVLPDDGTDVCPDEFEADAYTLRMQPDEFIMDRIQTIVQLCFARSFSSIATTDVIRKYAFKVTRYLGPAAYTFEGEITDNIIECLTENLKTIVPKKYFIHITTPTLHKMFDDILGVFNYERSEVNTEELISGIFSGAMDAAAEETDIINKSQFIMDYIFMMLLETLPLEEFQSETTFRSIVDLLSKEPIFNPKCISIENLVNACITHARDNLLDGITAVPIRRLAEKVVKDIIQLKASGLVVKCSIGSVASVSISEKRKL